MKAFLMHRDRDFDLERELPWNAAALVQDLELETLFHAMAQGDPFLYNVARKAILSGADNDLDTIRYRQGILQDSLDNPSVVRTIYQLPLDSAENKKRRWMGIFSRYPAGILSSAREMMFMFVELLKRLKRIADEHAGSFRSEGFTAFFAMLQRELDDDYFASIQSHLRELQFRGGVLISADLGRGNEGTNYVLRRPNPPDGNFVERLLGPREPVYTFRLHPRDDHGARALGELRDRGINLIANALAQSADHIDSFWKMLGTELAFYIGCLNLAEQLAQLGEPVTIPLVAGGGERRLAFTGLYDASLALTMKQKVVGNDVDAGGNDLVVITGANQGGKSTFLRSIGQAQLMMECGLFVPADTFSASVSSGLFTHYRREEDATMESGKLDEELGRMRAIADQVIPDAVVLFNESFAATNEREGSEIARQIIRALLEKGIRVFFVTHLYEFARSFYDRNMARALFLRAEREEDGTRTFKLREGRPLETSFGHDLYHRLFDGDAASSSTNGEDRQHGAAQEQGPVHIDQDSARAS